MDIGSQELDSVLVGKNVYEWCRKFDVLPSKWRVGEVESARILRSGVRLGVLGTPVCMIHLNSQGNTTCPAAIVVVDPQKYEEWIKQGELSRDHIISTLLHEIGHLVNPQVAIRCYESDEYEADDYVRHCGFGNALLTFLDKIRKIDSSFPLELTQKRINRIKNNEPHLTDGLLK